MKKISSLILVSILLLSVVGCGKSPVLPPVRNGTGRLRLEFAQDLTFESIYSDAVAVVLIQIGDWLGEDTDSCKTIYEATVLRCFKGSVPETFTYLQNGCSLATINNYPLLTSGNEQLVFLYDASQPDRESLYGSIASYTTVFDVSCDKSGNRYYGARSEMFAETLDISCNYIHNTTIYNEFLESITARDAVFSELTFKYIFSETDFLTLIENQ